VTSSSVLRRLKSVIRAIDHRVKTVSQFKSTLNVLPRTFCFRVGNRKYRPVPDQKYILLVSRFLSYEIIRHAHFFPERSSYFKLIHGCFRPYLPSSLVITHPTVQRYIDQAAVVFLFLLYSVLKNLLFLLSFFLILTSFYLVTASAVSYCYTSHSMTHTHTHTHSRTPLDDGSAHCKDLYLTTHNIHNRQTSTPPVEFEPVTPARAWPQTKVFLLAIE